MTKIFNKSSEKLKRQQLRNNSTQAELILWSRLRGKQIYNCKFRRQYSIDYFVIDFYAPEIKLAIEVDGDSHFLNNQTREYDQERQEVIESFGLVFLRFTNDQVYQELESVLDAIALKVAELKKMSSDLTIAPTLPLLRGGRIGSNFFLFPPFSRGG